MTALCLLGGCQPTLQAPSVDGLYVLPNAKLYPKRPKLTHFTVRGKIGFSDGKRGGNATLTWTQEGNRYDIRLLGPIGSGSVHITGRPGRVSLQDVEGRIMWAKNPEELVLNSFGWIMPVSELADWLQGMPARGSLPTSLTTDQHHHIWKIEQQDWIITYQSYQPMHSKTRYAPGSDNRHPAQHPYMPNKLILKNGRIRLKVVLTHWQCGMGE